MVDRRAAHGARGGRPARRRTAPAALAAALLLAAGAARGFSGSHPLDGARPLHERLRAADVVAIVLVEQVDAGRLRVHTERPLLGSPPERFEVKRSPSRPPPLQAGERALLLLRGARPPYVLVDQPTETIRLVDDAMRARWGDALAALIRAQDAPERLVALYLDWIDSGPTTLRELAVRGLLDRDAAFQPLAEPLLLARADIALAAHRSPEVRRASALLAMRSAAATDRLLTRLPLGGSGADVAVSLAALEAGAFHRRPALEPALRRLLGDSRAELRAGALRAARGLAQLTHTLREQLAAIAEGDPDPALREQARRLLEREG